MKRLLAALLFAFSTGAFANSASTDLSDMWWNANEGGWGMNLIHQSDTLFITMFVYANTSAPMWYVAPQVEFAGTLGGSLIYQGPLYATTGPWIGTTWDSAQVTVRQVGSLTVRVTTVETMVLTYTVDGVSVEKALTRQTWRTNFIAGQYIGATIGTNVQCPVNGYREEPATLTITQDATTATIVAAGATNTCTYTGAYTQAGRMGTIVGTFSCTNGTAGQTRVFEIEASISGITARAVAVTGACQFSGRIGGVRRGAG